MTDRRTLYEAHRLDEETCLGFLRTQAPAPDAATQARAVDLIETARAHPAGLLDAFMSEFSLSSEEGLSLLALSEALLRIPDSATIDALIEDRLEGLDWRSHVGQTSHWAVNGAAWGLALGDQLLADQGVLARLAEPAIRLALKQAIRTLAGQFVMGDTIDSALRRSGSGEQSRYRHSFDMLGEGARTQADADRHFEAYRAAIQAVGYHSGGAGPYAGPGISVKLSALHPRYEAAQSERIRAELVPRLAELWRHARDLSIGLTIDAEEAARLHLSLDVLERLEWGDGLGLAVQAYQKRALSLCRWLAETARDRHARLTVRLVKGAYWDSEIKRAQEAGLDTYPVFTSKAATDLSYLACAKTLFDNRQHIYPAFATHNALTIATIEALAGQDDRWEFQRLHGMGERIYDQIVDHRPCRVYAPVGEHRDLLPYLIRRMLENGANGTFVNQMADRSIAPSALTQTPTPACSMAPPREIFLPERFGARGYDLTEPDIAVAIEAAALQSPGLPAPPSSSPADVNRAVDAARRVWRAWDRTGGYHRAQVLEKSADIIERDALTLMSGLVGEAGKTIPDALAEIREAVDYLRYYAALARKHFDFATELPAPTGESNRWRLQGRGVFAAISPWNFPLAIFIGQIAAALASGNAVIAKPAPQTPGIAARAVEILRQAGLDPDLLHLVVGGTEIGTELVTHPAIDGVNFTGSTATAQAINQILARRPGAIIPLIAETGGINAMIADSSVLPEQLVDDIIVSSFRSAGQRCSSARILFLQKDIAKTVLDMLGGAVRELRLGDPRLLSTDIGPVIDGRAKARLQSYLDGLKHKARLLFEVPIPPGHEHMPLFGPCAFKIDNASLLAEEVFGPILHVVEFDRSRIQDVLQWINDSGYGLTLGVHSRIDTFWKQIAQDVRVGNIYVNRSQIGAQVGVQPFGGSGLSGTGPKAGGPHSLFRYATETTTTVNLTAVGGDVALLSGRRQPGFTGCGRS